MVIGVDSWKVSFTNLSPSEHPLDGNVVRYVNERVRHTSDQHVQHDDHGDEFERWNELNEWEIFKTNRGEPTGKCYVADSLRQFVLIDDGLAFRFARQVLDYNVRTFDRTHAEYCPKQCLQCRREIYEWISLLCFDLRVVVHSHHPFVVLIEPRQPWNRRV